MKEDYDGAEPSPNSVGALNLLRLSHMTEDAVMRERAQKTIAAFSRQLEKMPHAMPQMLVALAFELAPVKQIVIAGNPGAADVRALVRKVHAHFVPNKIVLHADGGEGQKFLAERSAFFKTVVPIDGRATAYVCENFVCKLPSADFVF